MRYIFHHLKVILIVNRFFKGDRDEVLTVAAFFILKGFQFRQKMVHISEINLDFTTVDELGNAVSALLSLRHNLNRMHVVLAYVDIH